MWEIKGKDNQTKATVYALEYNGEWMAESYVSVTIESPTPIAFAIGDYLMYRGERFEINYDPGKIKSAPQFAKGDAFKYENVKFNSLADELTRCDFLDVVLGDNQLHFTGLPKFSFYGGVQDVANRIQANLNRAYPNRWTVVVSSEYSGTKELNVSVDNIKVSGALEILVNQFETYYTIKGRTITIGAAGVPAGHLFKYGKGNGLYEIEQNAEADQAIVTRLRAYGSTRNLPHRYYNSLTGADGQKLIPDNMAVQNLMLPSFPYTTQDPYIDSANKAILGIRENTIFFDGSQEGLEEIYPSIEGMTAEQLKAAGVPCNSTGPLDVIVSAEQMTDDGVGDINEGETETTATPPTFKVTLKDLGFDINDHLTTEAATLSFKTGMLGGRDFEIVGCKAIKGAGEKTTGYELELNRVYDDGIKLWFPYKDYNAKAGDKFVILHIAMPEVYIKAAAQRLLEAATAWLSKNDYSRSVYAPKVDEIFMARQHDEAMASGGSIASLHDTLKEGMLLLFEDEDLNIDASIFIDRLTIKEGDGPAPTYEVVLKEEKTVGRLDKMQNQIDSLASGGGSYNAAQIRQLIDAYGGSRFLSKLKDDWAKGKIASDMGFEIGNYLAGVSGGMFGIDKTDGQSFADVFKLYVRGKAYFETLTIIEANTLAGKHYITPGGAIKCSKVEEIKNETGAVTAYRCYFLSEQDGEKTETKIVAGDQAISEMFNAKTGTTNKVSNHRYWRLVTAVNNDAYTDESGNHYGYVELSATDCESDSDIPQEGDVIDQLGNRTDKTRQAAMIFSTVDPDAPSIKLLTGIDHYTLTGKDIISQGYDPVKGHAFFNCYGDVFIGDKDGSTYIKYDQDTKSLLAKLKLTIDSTIDGKTLNDYFSSLIPELTQEDIEDFVNNIISPKLDGIQNQIDGVIETWFSNGVPTLNNYPASSWITGDDKEKHLGDLYFDNDSGLAYRFSKNTDGSYYWNDKVDSATAKALAAAAKAQDTADGKRRVFTSQPVPPYDKGDLWVNATYPAGTTALTRDPSTGKYYLDILRCGSAKAAGGSFAIGDWGLASNYTDDTLAQAAKKAADAAQKAADDAQADADEAKDRLYGWAADNVISPTEKQAIKDEIARIDGDKAHIEAEYTRYSLGAPTVYTAAYTAYRAQLVALSASTPENIAIPADFALNQAAYYTQRTGALTAIAAAAKKYAEDVAKDEANKAIAGLEYLKEAMVNGASQAIGGLFLSSHIRLGQWDKSDPTNPVLSKTYAGLNGLIPDSLTYKGSAIAAWYGGEMEDLFSYNAITGKYDLLTTPSPTKRYAASLFRMDGSMYLAKGNMFVQPDGFTQWGKGSSAVTISPDGVVSLGNGIKINIGGDVQGLADALSSLLTIVNGINNVLYPIDVAGNRLNWSAPVESIHAIKAVKGFFSTEFISALGLVQGDLGGGTGTGGGSLFGLMRSWPSVDPGPSTQEALGANLGWELRGRIAALETAGFATQNWVLNKNYLTAHQDISHLLSKTEAASLYQPKGNYLTSHQSLTHLLRIDGTNGTHAGVSALIGKLANAGGNVLDATIFVSSDNAGDASTPLYYRRPATALWNYIKGKADAVYQPKGNYALASALANYYTKTEVNTKLKDGSVTKVGTATVGSSNWPIYLNGGVPYACAWKFGNYNGAAAVNNGTLNENLNADLLDGLHVGEVPGRVARFYGFPGYTSFGYEGTADETYFSYLLKKLATDNSGEIMALGRAHPNSQGVFIMHGYTGRKNGYPQYGSGLYVSISGRVVPIRVNDGIYTYGDGIFEGNAASASRLQTTATYTAWGQTYFANGVPQSVSGNMSGVGSIRFSGTGELIVSNNRLCFGEYNQSAAAGVNVGSLLVSNAWADYTKVPVMGIYIKGALRIGDITIEEDKANGGLKISGGVYATKYVSALGLATGNLSGGSSGGGGTAYDRLDAWADYTTDKAGYVLSAGLGADLNSRVGANASSINSILSRLNSLEGGGTTSVTVTGSGNAITDISKGGTAIIATKGATFLTHYYVNSGTIDANTTKGPGEYQIRSGATLNNFPTTEFGTLLSFPSEYNRANQLYMGYGNAGIWFRAAGFSSGWSVWQKILTSANYASVLGSVYQAKGSYFTNQGHLTNKDFDTIITSGAGYIDATSTNKPSTIDYGQLLTLHGSGDTITQMAFDYANSGNVWVRSGNPSQVGGMGTWKPWVQMLTATNYASSLDSHYVTLGTAQTVTGAKTFSGGLLMPYSAGTWISMAKRANQILGAVPTEGSSAHSLFTLLNSTGAAISYGGLGVNIGFYGFYKARMDSGENSYDWATTWNLNTGRLSHSGDLVAHSFIKNGGTASQFLKADGSVDGNSYALASALSNYYTKTEADSRYVKKAGDTMTGALNFGDSKFSIRRAGDVLALKAGDGNDKLIITNDTVRRSAMTPTVYLGASDLRWSNVYATTINVTSTGLVSNLNADMLDGLHSTSFGRAFRNSAIDANDVDSLNGLWGGKLFNATNAPYIYYAFLHFGWGQYYGQFNAYNNQLQFRAGSESNGAPAWKTVAFTDSNVASATKLQTARTIYGVSFDGTDNVNGAFHWRGTDATLRIYEGVDPTAPAAHGHETLCLQSCFDLQDPLTSGYVTIHAPRCILALQPRGGRVAIGSLSAAYTLDVTGTGRFTGELQVPTVYASHWFRSMGNTGWYSQTHGGGIYMTDANWVRVYNNKGFRVQEGVGIGANGFIVGLKLHGASHEALEVSAGNYTMGLGCHSSGSWYWWRGTANPESAGNKSYVMQYDGSVWKFTGQLRCDSLRIGDAIFTYDAAHHGIKLDKGLYSEGYLSALGLSELTNTKFTISAGYESDALTILGGGITRTGYSGDAWNKGHGALNVAIDTSVGDSKQTPLLLAFSAGATDLNVNTSRLFALELLNNGDTLDFKLAGEVKLSINKIGLSAWSATLNYINATSIGTATVTATGKITCQSLTQTSDMRLKNVVRPIYLSVEAIAKAPSFIHQWKRGGAFDLGSSAQYWKEMSPLFTPRDKDGFLTMQYGKAALLSAIAIARRTVSHEERIRNLESENKKLRAELNGLKARLRA